jgi:predicted  nucleic acid-binding Zn-ribbon protein
LINTDCKRKITDLEKEILELRKKCGNLEKSKKQAETDMKSIDGLEREFQSTIKNYNMLSEAAATTEHQLNQHLDLQHLQRLKANYGEAITALR